jgi:type IV secretory pathway TrbD component
MLLLWVLTGCSLVVALVALTISAVNASQDPLSRHVYDEVRLDLAECQAAISSLQDRLRKLTARVSMKENREKRAAAPDEGDLSQQPGEDAVSWKARVRRVLAEKRVNGR